MVVIFDIFYHTKGFGHEDRHINNRDGTRKTRIDVTHI